MLVTIRPSELCGLSYRNPSHASNIFVPTRADRYPSTSSTTNGQTCSQRPGDNASIHDAEDEHSAVSQTISPQHEEEIRALLRTGPHLSPPDDDEEPPLPIPPRSPRRPSGRYVSQPTALAAAVSQPRSNHQRKTSVLGFFSQRDSNAGLASRQSVGDKALGPVHASAVVRNSAPLPGQTDKSKLGRLTLSKKRKEQQPTFSMLDPRPVSRRSVSNGLHFKPRLSMRPAPRRDWFPPSTSGSEEDLTVGKIRTRIDAAKSRAEALKTAANNHTRSRFDDTDESDVDVRLVPRRAGSPAAAYVLNASQEKDYTKVVKDHQQQQQSVELQETKDNALVAVTDIELEQPSNEQSEMPILMVKKAEEIVVQESEVAEPTSDDEEWPFPAYLSSGFALSISALESRDSAQEHSLHASMLSEGTNSTADTVISPVSTSQNAAGTETSPASSTEIDRTEEPIDSNLLLLKTAALDSDAASITESIVSERWTQSPKERLGLGSSIKRVDVLPWEESEGEVPERTSRSDGLNLSRRKSKRFSAFLGWT